MTSIFFLIIAAIAFAILAANIAEKKGYNDTLAGIICLAIPPIIIVYLLVPPKHRYCPKCGERNIHFLTNCRRCDTRL